MSICLRHEGLHRSQIPALRRHAIQWFVLFPQPSDMLKITEEVLRARRSNHRDNLDALPALGGNPANPRLLMMQDTTRALISTENKVRSTLNAGHIP
jgi:hypothetical protein